MKKLTLAIFILLAGCVTTTHPDGTTEKKTDLPGIIGGEKGTSNWCLAVDIAIIDPLSLCFNGKRQAEQSVTKSNK